jgi:uncharacterized phage protein (TIGR01671 family)
MRENKFRAQSAPKFGRVRWVYGDFFSQYKDGITSYYIVEHPHGRDAGREIMWPVNPDTLGEYTGLEDKSGVGIYEGDIVRERDVVGHVEWTWELLYRIQNKNGGPGIYPIITGDLRHENYFEVIGNIYENPELLK